MPSTDDVPPRTPLGRWRGRGQLAQRLRAGIDQAGAHYADVGQRLRASPESADVEALRRQMERRRDHLLGMAGESLRAGDIDGGWSFLHQLEREMVIALEPMELDARFISASSEAEKKLGVWRGEAVKKLVERYGSINRISGTDETGSRKSDDDPEVAKERASESSKQAADAERHRQSQQLLREVLFHLHVTHENVYYKLRRLRHQLRIVGLFVAATLALVLSLNARDFFSPLRAEIRYDIWLAVLSGLTGGVLSVAFSVIRSQPARRIPEVAASFAVTLIRPIVGAAIALPVLFILESGLLNIDSGDKLWVLLTFCFLGGFSERWFLGLVETVGSRARTSAQSEK